MLNQDIQAAVDTAFNVGLTLGFMMGTLGLLLVEFLIMTPLVNYLESFVTAQKLKRGQRHDK